MIGRGLATERIAGICPTRAGLGAVPTQQPDTKGPACWDEASPTPSYMTHTQHGSRKLGSRAADQSSGPTKPGHHPGKVARGPWASAAEPDSNETNRGGSVAVGTLSRRPLNYVDGEACARTLASGRTRPSRRSTTANEARSGLQQVQTGMLPSAPVEAGLPATVQPIPTLSREHVGACGFDSCPAQDIHDLSHPAHASAGRGAGGANSRRQSRLHDDHRRINFTAGENPAVAQDTQLARRGCEHASRATSLGRNATKVATPGTPASAQHVGLDDSCGRTRGGTGSESRAEVGQDRCGGAAEAPGTGLILGPRCLGGDQYDIGQCTGDGGIGQ